MTDSVLELLAERGLVHSVSDIDGLRSALKTPTSFYLGIDPTAPSLHVGHLIPLMLVARLQRAGHPAVILAGGGTGLIGDPSGKAETRKLLSADEIEANVAANTSQIGRFVDLGEGCAEVVNNVEWLSEIGYLEFLRDIGRYFSVNEMLATETYRERLQAGRNLNFVEINYRLMQAYDFLHLYRTHRCQLQVGGGDQWANIVAGIDLIRRVERAPAYGLVTPLLETSSGQKMGKTQKGALWLDARLTPPYEFFQYWINVDDDTVERLLALLTFMPMERVFELGKMRGRDARYAKEALAFEITAIVHGAAAAGESRAAAQALFGDGEGTLEGVPETVIDGCAIQAGVGVLDLLVTTGLAKSRGDARRLIDQGGAYLNGVRLVDPDLAVQHSDFKDDVLLLRAGRKRHRRVRFQS